MTGSASDTLDIDFTAVRGKKYLLASPSVAPVAFKAARHLRVAMMHLGNNGGLWAGDVSSDRGSVLAARNAALDGAFDADADMGIDGVLWVDDDLIMPVWALTVMAASGYDFVCGVYCQRNGEHMPLVGKFEVTPNGSRGFRWAVGLPDNAIMRADGCGFGMVYTSMTMLRTLGKGAFNHLGMSEDLSFCVRAMEAGFQLYCLTSLKCGHIGEPQVVTYERFLEKWANNPNRDNTELVTAGGVSAA